MALLTLTALTLIGFWPHALPTILARIAWIWALTFGLITRWLKISFHIAGAVGLAVFYGHWFHDPAGYLIAVIAALLIGWSRWRLGRHTIPELISGALLGAVIAFFAG
jgi:membrane-associated phospholipid phosphatase